MLSVLVSVHTFLSIVTFNNILLSNLSLSVHLFHSDLVIKLSAAHSLATHAIIIDLIAVIKGAELKLLLLTSLLHHRFCTQINLQQFCSQITPDLGTIFFRKIEHNMGLRKNFINN
jgi:hypothetical protein